MVARHSKSAPDHIRARLGQLRLDMRESQLDAFLATAHTDVSYLSDFSGEDSYLLVTRRSAVLISDSRFTEQANRECPGIRIFERKGPITAAVAALARPALLRRIGFDPSSITVLAHKQLAQALGARRLIRTKGPVRHARRRKDRHEVAAILRSIRVAQDAFLALLPQIKSGMTELQVAARLEMEMKIRGSSKPAFSTIVACGARTSMPHVQPGPGLIKPNMPILFDWGATIAGYKSDLTRVIFLDSICQSLQGIYPVVRQAARAALTTIRPGVPAKKVDEAARKVISQAGYGKYFGHGLGHGIGRNIHEAPAIAPKSRDILEEGMVFTVEPGIYLPRRGGIRIENNVLVTKNGYRLLSDLPDNEDWALRRKKSSTKPSSKKD